MNIKYKKTLLCFSILAAATTFGGCAAPQAVTESANRHLKGACRDIFLNSGAYQYQHVAQAPLGGRAVLALADDPKYGQFCAWSSNRHWDIQDKSMEIRSQWEKLEIAAIGRCEEIKPAHVKTPCKVFSRNNEIIWGQQKKIGLD